MLRTGVRRRTIFNFFENRVRSLRVPIALRSVEARDALKHFPDAEPADWRTRQIHSGNSRGQMSRLTAPSSKEKVDSQPTETSLTPTKRVQQLLNDKTAGRVHKQQKETPRAGRYCKPWLRAKGQGVSRKKNSGPEGCAVGAGEDTGETPRCLYTVHTHSLN